MFKVIKKGKNIPIFLLFVFNIYLPSLILSVKCEVKLELTIDINMVSLYLTLCKLYILSIGQVCSKSDPSRYLLVQSQQ